MNPVSRLSHTSSERFWVLVSPPQLALRYAVSLRERRGDLSPPLGYPGGPCHLINRIEEEIKNPQLRESLIDEVEIGKSLSNNQASKVYELETEKGPGGKLKNLVITSHAQYRMDLRSVTIPEVRLSLRNFQKTWADLKSQKNPLARSWEQDISYGKPISWYDPKTRLVLVFTVEKETVNIITTYWEGVPDPAPVDESRCPAARVASRWLEARAEIPAGKWVPVLSRTLDPDQESEVWECFGLSYGSVGLAYSSVRSLLAEHPVLWCIDVNGDQSIDAFLAYKKTKAGFKITFAGNNGTATAANAMVQKTLSILRSPGWYTESSGQVAKVLENRGFVPLDDEEAVREILQKDIQWLGNGLYLRNITGIGPRQKGIYGSPQIPSLAAKVACRFALKQGPEFVQTMVSPKSEGNLPTDTNRTKEQALPLPGSATPGGAGRDIPKFESNTPDSDSDIQPRTTGVPGEEYGVPYKDNTDTLTRRTMTSSDVPVLNILASYAPARERGGEGGGAQRRQKMQDQITSQKYYRQHRTTIKKKNKRRYNRKCKKDWRCKDRKSQYDKHPDYYARRAPKVATEPILFFLGESGEVSQIDHLDPAGGRVFFTTSEGSQNLDVNVFIRAAVWAPDEGEVLFQLLDETFGEDVIGDLDEASLRDIASLYGVNPDDEDFKVKCLALVGESSLSDMNPDQLEMVSDVLILGDEGEDVDSTQRAASEDADLEDLIDGISEAKKYAESLADLDLPPNSAKLAKAISSALDLAEIVEEVNDFHHNVKEAQSKAELLADELRKEKILAKKDEDEAQLELLDEASSALKQLIRELK